MAKDLNWVLQRAHETMLELRMGMEDFEKYPEDGLEMCQLARSVAVLMLDFASEAKKRHGKAVRNKEHVKRAEELFQRAKRERWVFSMADVAARKYQYNPTTDGTW